MSKIKKPSHKPITQFPAAADTLHREGDWLWIPLRREWRDVATKPEEIVRQRFIRGLVEHYGYSLDQMDQERRTQDGSRSGRADLVVWQAEQAKTRNRDVAFIAEFKSDKIEIQRTDYYQGESYARGSTAPSLALWNGEIANCVHQNHIIKARPDQTRLLPEFAMAWFNIEAGRDHFFQSGKTTSGLGTINSNVIRSAPIPLPSAAEQQRLINTLHEA